MAFRSLRNVFNKSNANLMPCETRSLDSALNDDDDNSNSPRKKSSLSAWKRIRARRHSGHSSEAIGGGGGGDVVEVAEDNAGSGPEADCNSNMSLVSMEGCRPPAKNCHRLVILGSSRVGKTCIVSRFLNNKFDDKYTPTIEDFHRKLYRIRGEVYQLDILDTSGNHPFPAMRRLSFLTGDLFILVYCIDSRESYEEVQRLRDQILETKFNALVDNSSTRTQRKAARIPMVIVGNKCDKEAERMVSAEEVTIFVSELTSCAFLETSAKKNIRIEDVFCELFLLGNLPLEMSPSLHKKVQPGYVGFCPSHRKKGLPLRRRLSDAYGTIAPNARRPSLRTDLLILQAKTADANGGSCARDYTRDLSCVLQ